MIKLAISPIFTKKSVHNFFLIIFFLFLCIFPKGGLKVGEIPLTWGYLLLGFVSIFLIFIGRFKVQKFHFTLYLCTLPFQILSLCTLGVYGTTSMGYSISFFVSFTFLPLLFFLIFSEHIQNISVQVFLKMVKQGVFFLGIYGIILFFYSISTGKFFGIPLLTTNLGDSLDMGNKYINRGIFFKLISTFNNGNIFGICLLMLLPMYQYSEKSFWKKAIVKIALLLTLSRTVWIGLIFHEFLDLCFLQKRNARNWTKLALWLLFFSLVSFVIIYKSSMSFSFFTDITLGNRAKQFSVIATTGLLGTKAFTPISEVSYMGVLDNFGYIGLISFLLAMLAPLFLSLYRKNQKTMYQCIRLGLCNYLFVSISDGAIMFIPTMVFFWFLSSLQVSDVFINCTVKLRPLGRRYKERIAKQS